MISLKSRRLGLLCAAAIIPMALLAAQPAAPVLAAATEAHETASESARLNAYLDEAFMAQLRHFPQSLSQLRLLEPQGITEHNGRLDDMTVMAGDMYYATLLAQHRAVSDFDDAILDEAARFNKKLFLYIIETEMREAAYRLHNYPVTQLYGWHGTLMDFMTTSHALANKEDADYYVARLEGVADQYAGVEEQLAVREEAGILPPSFIVDKVLSQLEALITEDAKEQALYSTLEPRLEAIDGLSADDKADILARTESAVRDIVLPSFKKLQTYLIGLREKTTADAGAWKHPDGLAFYNTQLRRYTTTELSAEEIHQIGLRKVAEIQGSMKDILAGEGYDVSGSFAKLIKDFAAEERHYYADTDEGRKEIIADYTAMVEEIEAGIASQFNLKPKAELEVHRVPTYIEKGAPGGYYSRPAADGSRPGRFYANLYDIKATPKFGMRALAYHEAIPGHHYQIALQQEKEDLPLFRKFGGFGAYIEGWALYSEQVAFDMGFQKTPFDKIGAYQAQLYRAVRLVVDTGLHAKGWSREKAIQYMSDNAGLADSDVVTEIERYIVWPGQATGYMIGQLEILRMRAKAKNALDDKFDVRDFHDVVLNSGAVPLTLLEEQIDAYIASKM